MSETLHASPRTASPTWHVRSATQHDLVAVTAAVLNLLQELGSKPPAQAAMELAAQSLIDDDEAGAVLVAETHNTLIGVLSASWQSAIHIPGRYALIQDLWVEPTWRSQAIGAALIDALVQLLSERGVARIEVGLPRPSFAGLQATEAFYTRAGFSALGPRLRLLLS